MRFASIECVSLVWLSMECSNASRSWMRVSVVRVRRDLGIEVASACRPGESQLVYDGKVKRERVLPCRRATFLRIMADGA